MYDLIKGFIDHTWDTSSYSSGEQTYVYVIAGILGIVFVVVLIDLVRDVFSRFLK